MVSLFPNDATNNSSKIELPAIIEWVLNGKWRKEIESHRALNTEVGLKQYEYTMLPYFKASATFMHRDENGINLPCRFAFLNAHKKHSELVNFGKLRRSIQQDSYTYSCILNCRGWSGGLTIIVKIPDLKEYHEASYRALKDYYESIFSITLDKAYSVASPCYISWDPDLYLNQNSDIFEVIEE